MNTLIVVAVGVLGIGYLLGAAQGYLHMLWKGCKGWKNSGKALVITLPETPQTLADVQYRDLSSGFYDTPSKEPSAQRDDKDRIMPSGPASYPSRLGPIHIVTSYGSSIVAPSKQEAAAQIEKAFVADWVANYKRLPKKEETEKDKEGKPGAFLEGFEAAKAQAGKIAKRFLIWDPLACFKSCQENDMQDLYNSNGGTKDPWYAKAAFIGVLIVGFLLLAVLGVLMMKIVPALAAHGG